jgi:hypothetical protein
MTGIRFIQKDGQSVDPDTIRQHFFECAVRSGVHLDRATVIWQAAIRGDTRAWDIVEQVCNVEIVGSDAGFGFLE